MQCQLSALISWPEDATQKPIKGPFRISYPNLLDELKRELRFLSAKNIELQMYVPETKLSKIRRKSDGWPADEARTIKPGVVLSFSCKDGDLQFACDTYGDYQGGYIGWQDNLRAISLTLENLRAIDRYGATKRGQQYQGYAALPPPPPSTPASAGLLRGSVEDALERLFAAAGKGYIARDVIDVQCDPQRMKALILEAKARTHPDRGGNPRDFQHVTEAAARLKEVYNL